MTVAATTMAESSAGPQASWIISGAVLSAIFLANGVAGFLGIVVDHVGTSGAMPSEQSTLY